MSIKNLFLTIAAAQLTYATEDLDTDFTNAQSVATSQLALSNSIQKTIAVYKSADAVVKNIEKVMEEDPVFAVLGFVTSMGKFFVNKEYNEILAQLADIQAQIAFLQQDMEYYFNKVLAAVHQDTCYAEYAQYELTIMQAVSKYNAWLANQNSPVADVYLESFMDECRNAKCDDATAALAAAITGNSGLFGCDMMEILYSGDVSGGYFVGWRDNVTSKAAYLLSLVNLGVVVQSAYITLETQNESAYTVVEMEYNQILLQAGKRIIDFDEKCQTDWLTNAEINSSRILQLNADYGLSNEDMSANTKTQMDAINPYRLWQVQSYSNVGGFDNHAYNCFDCIGYLHYANAYNILISSMATDSVANVQVLTDPRIVSDSNSKSDAVDLVNDIFNNLCVTGVHVVVRYVDEWISDDFEDRNTFQVGEKKTITVWAEEGFCDKNEYRTSVEQMFLQ